MEAVSIFSFSSFSAQGGTIPYREYPYALLPVSQESPRPLVLLFCFACSFFLFFFLGGGLLFFKGGGGGLSDFRLRSD